MKSLVIVVMLVAGFSAMSHAGQIYQCKGPKGKAVFQQTPCDQARVAGNSDAHKLWKEMRVLSSQGRTILNALGGDPESLRQCNHSMELYQKKLNKLSRRVERVSGKNPHLEKAYGYLKECAVCKTSAESNCLAADKSLDKAVQQLTEY